MRTHQYVHKKRAAQSSHNSVPPPSEVQSSVQPPAIQAKSNEEGLAEHAERLRKFQRLGNSMIQMGPPRLDNSTTSSLQPQPWIQRKLTIGESGDEYEQEADRLAVKVVDTINSPQAMAPLQRRADRANKPRQALECIQRQEQGTENGAVLENRDYEIEGVLERILEDLQSKMHGYESDIVQGIQKQLRKKMLQTSKYKRMKPSFKKTKPSFKRTKPSDPKALRKHVKDKARGFTKTSISEAISEHADAKKMPATYKYLEMKAKKKGIKSADIAAKDVLAELVTTGAFDAYDYQNIGYWMEMTVRNAVKLFLNNKKQPLKHEQAAKKDAANELDAFHKKHKKEVGRYAEDWKDRYLVAFDQKPETRTDLDDLTKKQVEAKDLGRTITKSIIAQSPEHSMSILSALIDQTVPRSGEKASLNVEFTIPMGSSPGYVLLGVKAIAARGLSGVVNAAPELDKDDDDSVEVRGDFIIGLGAQFLGGKADGAFNVFLRSGAADSIKAAQAISYGLYRFLVKKSPTMAQWWAARGKTSGISKAEQAEIWAAMVEEQVFAGGGVVDTGLGVRGRGEANLGLVGFGADMGLSAFTRYNQEIIGDISGKSPENKKEAKKRRKAIRGQGFGAIAGSLSAEASLFGLKGGKLAASYTMAFTKEPKDAKKPKGTRKPKVKTWEFSVSGDLDLGTSNEAGAIAANFTLGALSLFKQLKELAENKSKQDETGLRPSAEILKSLDDLKVAIRNLIEQNLEPLYTVEQPDVKNVTGDIVKPGGLKPGIFSKKKVRITLAVGLNKGKRVGRVSLWDVTTKKLSIPGLGSISAEQSRRIGSGSLEYELLKEYKLKLLEVESTSKIPQGKSLVYAVKLNDGNYYICIFDENKEKVAEKMLQSREKHKLTSNLEEAIKNKDKISNSKGNSIKKEIASCLGYRAKKKIKHKNILTD